MRILHKQVTKPTKRFTMVPNRIFSLGIPTDALCLYLWILARPEGWIFREEVMRRELCMGHSALWKAISSLKERGLLSSNLTRGKGGRFENTCWTIYSLPDNEETAPQTSLATSGTCLPELPPEDASPDRCTENGSTENGSTENGSTENRSTENGTTENRTMDFSTYNNTIYTNTEYSNTEGTKTDNNKTIKNKIYKKSSSSSSSDNGKNDTKGVSYTFRQEEDEEDYESIFSEGITGESSFSVTATEEKVLPLENSKEKVGQEDAKEAELLDSDTFDETGGTGLQGMLSALLREVSTTSQREISLGREKIDTRKLREELSTLTPEDIGPLADKVALAMEKEEIRNPEAYLLKSLRNAALAKKFNLPTKKAGADAAWSGDSGGNGEDTTQQTYRTRWAQQEEEQNRRIREYYFSQCEPAFKMRN